MASFAAMIVSVHIPKCGGISFEHVLCSIYGKKRVWRRYDALAQLGRAGTDRPPEGVRCIHGHFPSYTFDALAPDADLVTWLRHPVERVISNYHHFLRHPQPDNPCYRALRERNLSLESFAALDGMRNEATRYLGGKPAEAFKFIGIMEKYEESLERFGEIFGVSLPRKVPRENANPQRQSQTYPVTAETYARILALNLQDLRTYERAEADLDAWIRQRAAAEARVASETPAWSRAWRVGALWSRGRRPAHAVKFETPAAATAR